MADINVAAFEVFFFLKSKNMRVRSEKQLKTQLQSVWAALSPQERARYESIATECAESASSDSVSDSEATSRLLLLKKSLRRALLVCSRFLRSCSDAKMPPLLCPVKLPHEDILTCPVCSHAYDLGLKAPLCLPCGHTLCSDCVGVLSAKSPLTCPFDRNAVEKPLDCIRPNLLLYDSVVKTAESAECRKHSLQVVAYCPQDGNLLCGLCLSDYEDRTVIALESKEAADIVEEKMRKSMAALSEAGCVLQAVQSASDKLALFQQSLAEKSRPVGRSHVSTNKQLLRKLAKLRSSLSACVEATRTTVARGCQEVCAISRLPAWQRITQPLLEVPIPNLSITDVFTNLEAWLAYS